MKMQRQDDMFQPEPELDTPTEYSGALIAYSTAHRAWARENHPSPECDRLHAIMDTARLRFIAAGGELEND